MKLSDLLEYSYAEWIETPEPGDRYAPIEKKLHDLLAAEDVVEISNAFQRYLAAREAESFQAGYLSALDTIKNLFGGAE